jgi:hypothetical protein
MKKTVFGICALLTSVSLGLFAQSDSSSGLQEIQCEIVPTTPFSTSSQATYSGGKKSGLQMGSRTSSSLNWSGYASFTSKSLPEVGSVSYVAGEWKVPKVHPTEDTSYAASWVGIDGYSNGTVEQIGTTQGWENGHSIYYAWFQMYPGPSYEILGFPVNPKDHIKAEVTYIGNNIFELVIRNLTKKVFYVVPSIYTTTSGPQRTSAEWILEAPSINLGILPLARFSSISFSQCIATIQGKTDSINNHNWKDDRIIMVTEDGTYKAVPSSLSKSGKNFSVKWRHE